MVKADGPREKRVPIMMSDDELKAIDDWSFSNRIRTRAEAIRRLCQMGMIADREVPRITDRIAMDSDPLRDSLKELSDLVEIGASMPMLKEASHHARVLANHQVISALFDLTKLTVELSLFHASSELSGSDMAELQREYRQLTDTFDNARADDVERFLALIRSIYGKAEP